MMGNRGFTLFEMMMTIAIAALVVGFAIPAFQAVQINSGISSLSSEIVQAANEARSRAVTTRSRVYLVQGPGTSATDITTVAAGDWSQGWRMMTGPDIASATLISRNDKSRQVDEGSGKSAIRLLITDGAVDAKGEVTGSQINGFGFDNFGRLIVLNGGQLNGASIVICAPNVESERGRAISLSALGRVTNNVVSNPVSCS